MIATIKVSSDDFNVITNKTWSAVLNEIFSTIQVNHT
jgi:hypothetical protein